MDHRWTARSWSLLTKLNHRCRRCKSPVSGITRSTRRDGVQLISIIVERCNLIRPGGEKRMVTVALKRVSTTRTPVGDRATFSAILRSFEIVLLVARYGTEFCVRAAYLYVR